MRQQFPAVRVPKPRTLVKLTKPTTVLSINRLGGMGGVKKATVGVAGTLKRMSHGGFGRLPK